MLDNEPVVPDSLPLEVTSLRLVKSLSLPKELVRPLLASEVRADVANELSSLVTRSLLDRSDS